MKRIAIPVMLIVALAVISPAYAITLDDYYMMDSCNWVDADCKRAVRIMNYFMSKYPDQPLHLIDVKGATWLDVTPEPILKKYAVYHVDFDYGQKTPIGQQIFYCYACDPELAINVQEKFDNLIRVFIIPA